MKHKREIMVYLAVNGDGTGFVSNEIPRRNFITKSWFAGRRFPNGIEYPYHVILPKGTIKKLTGKDMTWKDKYIKYEGI